jgi:hypothetical protein
MGDPPLWLIQRRWLLWNYASPWVRWAAIQPEGTSSMAAKAKHPKQQNEAGGPLTGTNAQFHSPLGRRPHCPPPVHQRAPHRLRVHAECFFPLVFALWLSRRDLSIKPAALPLPAFGRRRIRSMTLFEPGLRLALPMAHRAHLASIDQTKSVRLQRSWIQPWRACSDANLSIFALSQLTRQVIMAFAPSYKHLWLQAAAFSSPLGRVQQQGAQPLLPIFARSMHVATVHGRRGVRVCEAKCAQVLGQK